MTQFGLPANLSPRRSFRLAFYGFLLVGVIYLLSGWLQTQLPAVNWFSHDAGHLLEMWFGWRVNPH